MTTAVEVKPETYAQVVNRLKAEQVDRSGESAEDLLAFLSEWGTPHDVVRRLGQWIDEVPVAKAQDLYDHMRNTNPDDPHRPEPPITEGTLRRAALWTYGREPDQAEQMAPAEELTRLRAECDRLHEMVAAIRAEKLGLTNANTSLQEQLKTATTQLSVFTAGRTQPEIAPPKPHRRAKPDAVDPVESKAETK